VWLAGRRFESCYGQQLKQRLRHFNSDPLAGEEGGNKKRAARTTAPLARGSVAEIQRHALALDRVGAPSELRDPVVAAALGEIVLDRLSDLRAAVRLRHLRLVCRRGFRLQRLRRRYSKGWLGGWQGGSAAGAPRPLGWPPRVQDVGAADTNGPTSRSSPGIEERRARSRPSWRFQKQCHLALFPAGQHRRYG
jgi:hypothetical protein